MVWEKENKTTVVVRFRVRTEGVNSSGLWMCVCVCPMLDTVGLGVCVFTLPDDHSLWLVSPTTSIVLGDVDACPCVCVCACLFYFANLFTTFVIAGMTTTVANDDGIEERRIDLRRC